MTGFADQQRSDFGSVQDRAAADGQTDSRPDEKPSKDGGEQLVGCDIGIFHERQTEGETGNRQSTLQRKLPPDLAVADGDKWEVDDQYPDGQRETRHVGE